jgi:outer membrane protein assembly factor BamB
VTRRMRSAVAAGLVLVAVAMLSTASASARTGQWKMFHHDARHTGVSGDNTFGVGNAGNIGLDWAVNTGSASYTSPVVARSASLGKTLVYAANQMGSLSAYNAASGVRQWVLQLGASIQSSPAIANNVIYFGANDHHLYAVDASTGTVLCSYTTPGNISSSPTIANPDGHGLVVYFGENGLTGADDGGAEYAINAVDPNAAPNCSLKWQFTGFGSPPGSATLAGSWSPPAFGTDKNGRRLVVFGGSSPDCAVYALDALTGQLVWRFQTRIFAQDNDVGAGPTITLPGVNGFKDGRVYVGGKDRIFYSLNLRTGAKAWQFSIRNDAPSVGGATRSTAAVLKTRVYVGYGAGVYALSALNGARIWRSQISGGGAEVISSPAITGKNGPGGGRVLFVGDMSGQGRFRAYSMTGALKWGYRTGGFIYGSPAIADGHVYITSSDGFLYAFAPGGAIGPKPGTAITSPADGASVPNTGSVSVKGTATARKRVTRVLVAVKNKNTGQWWNAGTQTWGKTYQESAATLGKPGTAKTGWSTSFTVPFDGGPFLIQASAVDGGGQHDPTPASHSILVDANGDPPDTTITDPVFRQVFHEPLDPATGKFDCDTTPCNITISGTATDSGGANPGIAAVHVTIRNIEHSEYYCGVDPSNHEGGGCWQSTIFVNDANLASPGSVSTNWSMTFQIYDHPHKYRIVAWATDKDGENDPTRSVIGRICLRNPGDNTCA